MNSEDLSKIKNIRQLSGETVQIPLIKKFHIAGENVIGVVDQVIETPIEYLADEDKSE